MRNFSKSIGAVMVFMCAFICIVSGRIYGENLLKTFPAVFYLSNINGTNGFIMSGFASGKCGGSVSGIKDINGDGIDDIIVGASGANDWAGQSYVIFGRH